jgi:tetratricopeptide (TPR) repeat protein
MWEDMMLEDSNYNTLAATNLEKREETSETSLHAIDDEGMGYTSGAPNELAREMKAKGDDSFRKQQWESALEYYTRALGYTPDNEKLLSNRSAVYVEMGLHQQALDDAMRCGEISPEWPKAFFRQGLALRALKRYDMAISAFSEGLTRDPTNPSWQTELEETERLKAARKAARAARCSR